MSPKQLHAHRQGILAHAKHLYAKGIPFDHYRVRQVLDAIILLGRQGVPREEWEADFERILQLFGERPAPA
jgi:hypothetical protein